jgi:hypothetical protein
MGGILLYSSLDKKETEAKFILKSNKVSSMGYFCNFVIACLLDNQCDLPPMVIIP